MSRNPWRRKTLDSGLQTLQKVKMYLQPPQEWKERPEESWSGQIGRPRFSATHPVLTRVLPASRSPPCADLLFVGSELRFKILIHEEIFGKDISREVMCWVPNWQEQFSWEWPALAGSWPSGSRANSCQLPEKAAKHISSRFGTCTSPKTWQIQDDLDICNFISVESRLKWTNPFLFWIPNRQILGNYSVCG